MYIDVRVKGLAKVKRKFEAMARTSGLAVGAGTRLLGEAVATDVRASRPGAGIPKDEGTLARSIRVEGPNSRLLVRLTAGGASAPYALVQHEVLTYRHELGEARYWIRGLERAVAQGTPEKALAASAAAVIAAGKAAQ